MSREPGGGTRTTGEYLDRHFKSAALKALLATQWGDYGLPPSESAFVLHAIVVRSYLRGDGFRRAALAVSRVRLRWALKQRAAPSMCATRSRHPCRRHECHWSKGPRQTRAAPVETEFFAPIVISDAGAHVTYKRLLPVDGEIGRRTAGLRAAIDRLDGGYRP